jgi:hypothetical protein
MVLVEFNVQHCIIYGGVHFESQVRKMPNLQTGTQRKLGLRGILGGSHGKLSGGIENFQVYGNVIGQCESGHDNLGSCGWGIAIHFKTTVTRGEFLRNISVRNNTIYNNSFFSATRN